LGLLILSALGDIGLGDIDPGFIGVVEEGHEPVVIPMLDGIVFVGVALGAGHGEAEPGGGGDMDAIDHGVEPVLEGIDAAFLIDHGVAVEPGGDALIERGVREQITGELFDGELIERHILVEGLDDPIAPGPDRAGRSFS
jgi:hypothetical protein